jgi:hypothetical protein
VATATLPRDLSPWGMFVNADSVVKAVLIGLAFASLVTWTVWLAKSIEIVICKRRMRAALSILASVRSASEGVERLADTKGEVRQFLDAAVTELKLSAGSIERDGIKERRGRHVVGAQSVAVAECGPVRNAAELRPLDSAAYHVRDRLTVARPFRVSSQTPRGESLRKRPSAISWLRIEQIKFHHRG